MISINKKLGAFGGIPCKKKEVAVLVNHKIKYSYVHWDCEGLYPYSAPNGIDLINELILEALRAHHNITATYNAFFGMAKVLKKNAMPLAKEIEGILKREVRHQSPAQRWLP